MTEPPFFVVRNPFKTSTRERKKIKQIGKELKRTKKVEHEPKGRCGSVMIL